MPFSEQFSIEEQALLRLRAERAALSSLDTPEVLASIDTLVVMLGKETYGLPLRALTAVYQLTTPIIPVPCTPSFIAGITNIRGHVVTVIDLAVLLAIPNATATDYTAIVIVSNETMTVAFRVSALGEALLVKTTELAPVSGLFDLAQKTYVQGTLPDGTIVLNVDAILNDPALIVDESMN